MQPNVVRPHERSFFGHPRGLATLFSTEMWERFSYYGMRALLILFMTERVAQGGLGWDAKRAATLYGLYTALRDAILTHPTMAEGLTVLFANKTSSPAQGP